MKLLVTLHDCKGEPLNEGDLVEIRSDRYAYFAEVKWLSKEQSIAPFHTFSFHQIEKIAKLPEGAVKLEEQRFGVWYLPDVENYPDHTYERHQRYLTEWRDCETLLKEKIFRVEKVINQTGQLSLL